MTTNQDSDDKCILPSIVCRYDYWSYFSFSVLFFYETWSWFTSIRQVLTDCHENFLSLFLILTDFVEIANRRKAIQFVAFLVVNRYILVFTVPQ